MALTTIDTGGGGGGGGGSSSSAGIHVAAIIFFGLLALGLATTKWAPVVKWGLGLLALSILLMRWRALESVLRG